MTPDRSWLDEIDLDPSGTWLTMGLRRLGDEPWLIRDAQRERELALRARLLDERPGEVLAVEPESHPAAHEVYELITADLASAPIASAAPVGDGSPLERIGRMVQEDLCLLRRDPDGWVLAAAVLCFPSRWRLADKLGRPVGEVHAPVAGYSERLSRRVDTALDRLGDAVFLRRNWFLHPDAALFQPDRPPHGDPLISAERCLDDLYLRSERQTLRLLPASGWILFTIRIQQVPLRSLVLDDRRREHFTGYVEAAPADQRRHRGISDEQAAILRSPEIYRSGP